jgi:hypothetical protein
MISVSEHTITNVTARYTFCLSRVLAFLFNSNPNKWSSKMSRLAAIVFFILSLSNAYAQPPMIAYDVTPPDYQCTPGVARNCYIPIGPDFVWTPINQRAGGPQFTHAYVSFTLANPQTVEITFDALYFLYPFAMYTPGIAIDGYDQAHLCSGEVQGGLTNDNGATNLSLQSRAICLIQLPAGQHTVYAMEMIRGNLAAFRGAVNQSLIVRFW